MAAEFALLTENGTAGTYWSSLSTAEKARYYFSGNYQVFASISAWKASAATRADPKINLTLEIEGSWVDTSSGYTDIFGRYFSVKLTTKINGIWGSGFHNGIIGAGWRNIRAGSILRTDGPRSVLEGINVESTGSMGILPVGPTQIRNCIIKAATDGIGSYGDLHVIQNNLIHSCGGTGIKLPSYKTRHYLYNNTVIKCDIGITDGSECYAINNVVYGCTTANWNTAPTKGYQNNNAGEAGDVIWSLGGGTSHVITASDFKDYVGEDYRPSGDSSAHTSTSVLVDNGVKEFNNIDDIDITGGTRPSYKNTPTADVDIGAYEFDWGYGLAPQTVTIKITVVTTSGTPIANARVRLLKTSDSTVVLEGVTDSSGILQDTAYTYTADTDVTGWVRKSTSAPLYKQGVMSGTITENGLTATIAMVSDE